MQSNDQVPTIVEPLFLMDGWMGANVEVTPIMNFDLKKGFSNR